MPLVVRDRVKETTTTTGTGSYLLSGAVAGFQSFSVIGNGNTTFYAVAGNGEWEVGIGTYSTTGPTLARTTILESSNAGNAVNWGAGTKDIFCTYAADNSVYVDSGIITPATAARLNFDNLAQGASLSVLGRSTNSLGDVGSIAAASDNQVLRRSGTALGFGQVNLASTNAVTGALPAGNGGTGLTSPGSSGNILRSTGTGWASVAPPYGLDKGVTATLVTRAATNYLVVDVIGSGNYIITFNKVRSTSNARISYVYSDGSGLSGFIYGGGFSSTWQTLGSSTLTAYGSTSAITPELTGNLLVISGASNYGLNGTLFFSVDNSATPYPNFLSGQLFFRSSTSTNVIVNFTGGVNISNVNTASIGFTASTGTITGTIRIYRMLF